MKNLLTRLSGSTLAFIGGVLLVAGATIVYADRVPVSANAGLVTTGPCIASSTLFAVQNPLAGTSTLSLFTLTGTQGATTTDIVIATSTTAFPPFTTSTSTIGENIMGLATVATGTQFYSQAGVNLGPGGGYTIPTGVTAGGTYRSNAQIVVGPNEWVVGFSTSTYISVRAGATSTPSILSVCIHKEIWVQ